MRQFKPEQLRSGSYSISGSFSGSFQGDGSKVLGVITSSYAHNADLLDNRNSTTYANTGSNIFVGQQVITGSVFITGSQVINGNLNVSNNIIASGSTKFGDSVADTHQFTGSLLLTASHISTVDYIDFNPNVAAPGFNTGRLHWTDDTKTLQLDTDVNGFELEIGHQSIIRGRNTNSFTLTKGTVVYINGESGNRPTFATASWEGDPSSATTIGIIAQDINNNQTGYAVTDGLIRGINTNAFSPGTSLYLSSSGQYTDTPPLSPLHEVRLGKTITQATNGIIYIDIQNGYELGELHDVLITSASNGDLISWDSGSRVWKNTKTLSGSYGISGSLNVTSATGSFTGSFSGSFSANLQQVTNNGSSTTNAITASSIQTNNLHVIGNATVTGSLIVSGSNTFKNIGPAQFTGSVDITGSGTLNGSPLVTNAVFYPFTASYYLDSSSFDTRITSNSSSTSTLSGSFLTFSGSYVTDSSSFDTRILNNSSSISILSGSFESFTQTYNTGSFTGSFTGSLFGTASWASNAVTASFITASGVFGPFGANSVISSSFATQALSASWAPGTSAFPYTGSALITGSLGVTGSLTTLGLSSFINPLTYSGNQTTVPLISLNQPLLSFGNSSVIFRATETSVNNSFAVELYKRNGNSETRFLVGGTGTGTNTEQPFMTVIGTNTAGEGSVTFDRSVGIGSTPSSSIRLDVRAQGALSTDIAFRVRNSADTDNIISVKGNRNIFLLGETNNGRIELSANGGNASMVHRATAILPSQFIIGSLGDGGSVGQIVFAALDGTNTYPTFTMQRLISGLSDLVGSSLYTGFGTNAATFVMKNASGYAGIGTNPTGTATDHFAMYSADVAAGTASAHFRNEAGHVVKLYTQSPVTSSQGIADALTNLGLLTGSSVIASTNPFPYTGSAQITGSVVINNYLNTAVQVTANSGATTIYTLPTASYDGAWFEYSARSGSNARAGQITAIWSGSAVNFTETATTDFGTTAGLALGVFIVGADMALTASAATSGWTIKTIIRSM